MSEPCKGTPGMIMRGGTSKGVYFLAADLPQEVAERDARLLAIMGSPDPRQIDGVGGANPLTSKVAIVSPSRRPGVDVDYLFLQIFVDQPIVTSGQNCGNILAGVGPFAIERGLVSPTGESTDVRIYMANTGQRATATVATPGGYVGYAGDARIDGVPGTAAPIPIIFEETAGSSCGALLPTGNAADTIDGIAVTLIDNGMPCVIIDAADLGVEGDESPAQLDGNQALKSRLESIRRAAGPLMNLGDVTEKSVPKMTLVSKARDGGHIATRSFIPHRCHEAIGVLAAVSVASACLLPDGPAARYSPLTAHGDLAISVEHPSGEFTVIAKCDAKGNLISSGVLRTARKLADGLIF